MREWGGGFRVYGLGFRVYGVRPIGGEEDLAPALGVEFRRQGLMFMGESSESRVQGPGFRVQGSGSRVPALGWGVRFRCQGAALNR